MPTAHLLLISAVVLLWGCNFLFVGYALKEISPLFLCAIRFLLTSVPAIFFIKLPRASYKIIVLYGLVMFAMQFTFVFTGMHVGMTPGMASLIMQVQVFFSIFFAAMVLKEKPYSWQLVGALISFSGIALVAVHFDSHVTALGFLLILAAAATWGAGNLITKKLNGVSIIALIAWGSFFAVFPMMLLSYLFEGTAQLALNYQRITWLGFGSVLYIVIASTWLGYGIWNWLLTRHPVGTVVPFTLLIPVVSLVSSMLFFGEPLQSWKIIAALLVIIGLAVNILGLKLFIPSRTLAQETE